MPVYGAADDIASTIARIRAELSDLNDDGDLEVVIVDDGSGDRTADAARAAGADQVVEHLLNRGKGAAVRTGMLSARGRTLAFTDADLSYSPRQLLGVLAKVESGAGMAVGSRYHRESTMPRRASTVRRLTSRLFNLATFVILGIGRDTQCGLKAFRAPVARLLFAKGRIDGFAFDVELFELARRYGVEIAEVPVDLTSSETSTVSLRGELRALADLPRLRRLARSNAYDLTPEDQNTLRA